jgi:hypothetical protein
MWILQIKHGFYGIFLRKLRNFEITKNSVMRAIRLFSNISLQTDLAATDNMVKLEGNILIPAICIIMVLVMVAGIVITVQKHKRY